eukprot:3602649-Prymnesium_polylepis.1
MRRKSGKRGVGGGGGNEVARAIIPGARARQSGRVHPTALLGGGDTLRETDGTWDNGREHAWTQ